MIFVCFMPAVILSETSRRHCVSNSATSRNKELVHIESSDMYEYSCAGKINLHINMPRVSSDPIHFLQKKEK